MLLIGLLTWSTCNNDDDPNPSGDLLSIDQIFPQSNVGGKPVLITGEGFERMATQVEFDGMTAAIDTVVPTGDSLVAIVPDRIAPGSVKVLVRSNDQRDSLTYSILTATEFANLPATPPTFVFPGGGNISTAIISNDAPATLLVVNVQDIDHEMNIPVDDSLFTAGASPGADCDFQVETFRGQQTCISVTWRPGTSACDLPDTEIVELELLRAAPLSVDRFSGKFYDSVDVAISEEVADLLDQRVRTTAAENRFLILTSLIDQRQYVFAILGGTREDDLENIFCRP